MLHRANVRRGLTQDALENIVALPLACDLSSVVVIIVGPMLVNITSRPTFLGRHLFRYPSEIIPEITPEVSRSHPGALALTLPGDR